VVFAAGTQSAFTTCQFITNIVQAGELSSGPPVRGGGNSYGGAIAVLAGMSFLSNCVFNGNQATGATKVASWPTVSGSANGSAIFHRDGAMSILASLFTKNTAVGGGGAARGGGMPLVCADANGGALFNDSGTLELRESALIENSTTGGTGYFSFIAGNGSGGAAYNRGSMNIVNCTIANNKAFGGSAASSVVFNSGGSAYGGGVWNGQGTVALVNASIAGNTVAVGASPGISPRPPFPTALGSSIYVSAGSVALTNTLLSASAPAQTNVSGVLIDGGHNLSSDDSCHFTAQGSLNGTDPILGPLDDYGGPTPTIPLLAGSPAIDNGNTTVAPLTDQRGRARPFGVASDIGAFESSPPYSIHGQLTGFFSLTNITIAASSNVTTKTEADGRFALQGLAAGNYNLAPVATNFLFQPASQTVTVGPDAFGVLFKGYLLNGLTPELSTNNAGHFTIAGQPGTVWQVQRSTNLVNWQTFLTNTIGTDGLSEVLDTNYTSLQLYRASR
jgi:hypothetical protein